MLVNIHAAKTNLSKLIERMEAGEEVIIARAGKPVAKLSPIPKSEAAPAKGAWLGSLRGQIWIAPDAFDHDEDLVRQMEDGDIFPPSEAES